jgi:acyl-CoA thioester hydrolase
MNTFKFYYPVQVRYGDLDPQWHVNNSRYLTFIESARLAYIQQLGLWDGKSFMELGLIVADVHMTYIEPIQPGQTIKVGVKATRIGNKSLDFEYQIEDADSGNVLATATTIMVAYSYHTLSTIRVTDKWRKAIGEFENLDI